MSKNGCERQALVAQGAPPRAGGTRAPRTSSVVGERHRKDMGDIDALAASISSPRAVRVHELAVLSLFSFFGQLGAPRMLGSKNILTGSGNARLDVMQRLTSPGMIDWVDLDGSNHCASCRHFHQRHCMLFVQMMRSRLKNSRFLGPKLPHGQRACRRYEKAQGAGAHGHASKMGNDEMKVSERYPSAILKASDLEGGDLVVQVDNIELDVELGNSGKYVDLLRFTNDPRALSLGPTNARIIASLLGDDSDDWPGGWLSLFKDPTVKFGDTEVGGVRVRPRAPTEEEIAAAAPPTRQPGSKPATKPSDGKRPPSRTLDDEVPF